MIFNQDTKEIAFEVYKRARQLKETAQNLQALSAEAALVDSADEARALSFALERRMVTAPFQVEQLEVVVGELLAVLARIKAAGGKRAHHDKLRSHVPGNRDRAQPENT